MPPETTRNKPCRTSRPCSPTSSASRNSRHAAQRPAMTVNIPHRQPDFCAMLCMHGQGVVKGYAIGKAAVMSAAALEVAHYRIAPDDAGAECDRLKNAIIIARDELQHMAATLPDDAPRELGPLLTVHSLLLDDPMLFQQTCELINERLYNAEWALTSQGQFLAEQFSLMEDEYLRERAADIRQVIERVLRVLSGSTALLSNLDVDAFNDPF